MVYRETVWLVRRENNFTPFEPSEGMEFVKNGIVNAGAIFFAIALLSTLPFWEVVLWLGVSHRTTSRLVLLAFAKNADTTQAITEPVC